MMPGTPLTSPLATATAACAQVATAGMNIRQRVCDLSELRLPSTSFPTPTTAQLCRLFFIALDGELQPAPKVEIDRVAHPDLLTTLLKTVDLQQLKTVEETLSSSGLSTAKQRIQATHWQYSIPLGREYDRAESRAGLPQRRLQDYDVDVDEIERCFNYFTAIAIVLSNTVRLSTKGVPFPPHLAAACAQITGHPADQKSFSALHGRFVTAHDLTQQIVFADGLNFSTASLLVHSANQAIQLLRAIPDDHAHYCRHSRLNRIPVIRTGFRFLNNYVFTPRIVAAVNHMSLTLAKFAVGLTTAMQKAAEGQAQLVEMAERGCQAKASSNSD